MSRYILTGGFLLLFLIACQREDKVYKEIQGTWKLASIQLDDNLLVDSIPVIELTYSDCSASQSSGGSKCEAIYKSNGAAQNIQYEITSDRNADYINHRSIETNSDTARLDVEGQIIFHLLSSLEVNGYKTSEMTMKTFSSADKFYYNGREHDKVELTFQKQ